MNFSAWAIRNPVPSILLFIVLSILGLYSLDKLAIQDFPDMDLPTISISASLEGTAPEQLETEVARKIEDKLASLSKLDHITTTITDGSVSISVSFEIDKNSEEALNEVRNAVDSAKADLPTNMNTPTVSKVTSASSALLTYSIEAANMKEDELSWFVDNDVTKAMLAVKGVSKIERVGGIDREVHVELDPTQMTGLGISLSSLSTQLKAMQKDASGGRAELGNDQQSFRILAAAQTAADIAKLNIPLADGRRIQLNQIGRITEGYAERSSLAFVNDKPVIAFQITRSKGFSDVSVREDVRAAVTQFSVLHPQVVITEISNTVEPIVDNYHGSMHLLLEGALLAVVVVWFFLRDWRATVISATALPLSIIPTFFVMELAGFSLNTVTLLALALVIGILVDDAIVEVENIARHQRMGKSARQSALEAAAEIGLAVIATTFTLVSVFLPTAFMSGIPGKIFRQFGITAAAAVLASLLVARLLTPMMAAYFMKTDQHKHEQHDSWLMSHYLSWVNTCLKHRNKTLIAAIVFFVASLSLIPLLSTAFMPAMDDGQTKVTITLPPGSSLESTATVAQKVTTVLRQIPDITHVFVAAGTASSGSGMQSSNSSETNGATLIVDMKPRGERRKQSAVESEIRNKLAAIAGIRVEIGRGGSGEKLEVTLAGDDATVLETAASSLEREMRMIKGVGAITSSASLQRPEIQIVPDFARASQLGVTVDALSESIRLATYGANSSDLNKLNLPQRQISVRLRLDPTLRSDLERISQLSVTGTDGQVNLSSIADIQLGSGPTEIDRIDRYRNITLSVELSGRPLGEVMGEVQQLPSMQHLPEGVHVVNQGELQRMYEMLGSFGAAMGIGILCVYVVLVLLFHDFLQPITILGALPLSVGGALVALLTTGGSFGMPAVIGILMLMGIVTKNSILLVEYAIIARRDHGMSRLDALIDACHKRSRPILMTTIAMSAGMLPIALGMGADPSFRQPMAIIVIGGLITSTCLSLLVIPVLFTYIDDLHNKIKKHVA